MEARLDLIAMSRREIWFSSAGVQLFAVESGAGKPIILLHAGLATHEACLRFAAPLADRYRIITPDLRASGRSIYAGELAWDQLADDVAALVRYLGVERAVIGGVSFGAGCAIRVALRHPSLVAALVLVHPAYGGAELGYTDAQRLALNLIDAAARRATTEGVTALLPLVDLLPRAMRERTRAIVATYDPASVAASTRFMVSAVQPFEHPHELAAITVPSLLVPGTDLHHPAEVSDVYRRHLPRCTVSDVDTGEFPSAIAALADQSPI